MQQAERKQAIVSIVTIVADAIKELGTVPEGVLYANLSGYFTLRDFTMIIDLLLDAKLVRRDNFVLTWTGE